MNPFRWLLLPWWAFQVFTAEKSFAGNGIIGSRALNRRGLHVWRGRVAARMTEWRRRRLAHLVSAEDRAAYDRDGFVLKPNFTPPDLFPRLIAEIEALSAQAREFKEGDAITRRIPLTPENLRRLPACKRLLEMPAWRGLLRYVSSFDAEPLVFVQTIFTHVDERSKPDPQTSIHMDTFHPTMKAWLFLHEVAEEEGPFTYVVGSHRMTGRREVWERARSVEASGQKGGAFRIKPFMLKKLGYPKPSKFAVAANTLVVADTHGFHARGVSTRSSARVEIWAYSRRNPFLPWTGFDLGSVPPVRSRQAVIAWKFMELKGKLGLPTPKWRDTGAVSPAAPPAPWPEAART
ncbi:MAG TPA: phytanoyl-CoA dioxygenase family protein [Caulobacteraceae bacterium]